MEAGWTCVCGASRLQGAWCPYCGRWAWWCTPQAAGPPPPPPRRGLDARGRALAAVVALLVVAGFGRVVLVRATERDARRAALGAAVQELTAFIADFHGSPFRGRVQVRLMEEGTFDDVVGGPVDDIGDETTPHDFDATMAALGLAGPSPGPEEDGDGDGGGGAVGVYDSDAEILYVRGREITPYTRLVLVHELTHAWQDQQHDLSALLANVEDADQHAALSALVEGDATRVENAWRARLPAADRAAIEAVEDASLGDQGEREASAVDALSSFPYVVGERFATAVFARGGNVALHAAFRDPPASTEQVVDPAAYFAKERPVEVSAPEPEGELLDEGVLGQLGLALVAAGGEVGPEMWDAVEGWEGDSYVTWRSARGTCTDVAVATESAAARDRLAAALRATRAVVTTPGARRVEVRRCSGG